MKEQEQNFVSITENIKIFIPEISVYIFIVTYLFIIAVTGSMGQITVLK